MGSVATSDAQVGVDAATVGVEHLLDLTAPLHQPRTAGIRPGGLVANLKPSIASDLACRSADLLKLRLADSAMEPQTDPHLLGGYDGGKA